ncbi:hypothetical protein TWF281_005375 [Arthrobotrys megalospora]
MLSKALFLLVSTTFVVFSHALPTNSGPSTEADSKYAKLKAQNPFPAKQPYIHVDETNAVNSTIEARGFLEAVSGLFKLLGVHENEPRSTVGPTCTGDVECQTNTAIFAISLNDFIGNYRNKGLNSPPLIYESDGCSVPDKVAEFFKINKDFPYGYEFLNSCYRHDFGYRNFKAQNRFTDGNREDIDQRFQGDLLAQCSSQFPKADIFHPVQLFNRKWCNTVAKVYYKFVRLCGGGNCKVEKVIDLFKEVVH